jgi:high affinity Mn2+ porin
MRNKTRNKAQKLLAGLASLTLVDIAVATAADFPLKAVKARPVALVPAYDWSGFYLGGHAGYRWASADFFGPAYGFDPGIGTVSFPARSETYRLNGGIIGVQAGYNVMITPTILAGLEGDWTWGSSRDGTAGGFIVVNASDSFSFVSQVRLTWQATIRGRLGIVNGPWLFYGTGGAAFTRVNWTDNSTFLINGTPSAFSLSDAGNTLTGVAMGGGAEYMWMLNWIARIEYLYENFGNASVPFGLGPQVGTLDLRDVSKLRIAISYKFHP